MKQKFIDIIEAAGLADDFKQEIFDSLTERFIMEPFAAEIKMGDSKIGGYPHLPKGFEYPQEADFFYEFVGQIKIEKLN